ncbi:S-methyl-5-thioribose-1-phosphate isomerase [Christensenellaceae bacterium OttesenSCG-928-L17]|nr:S-methyl-5-thioribose-1-phosphate isomerase [Christensenellaceae bacterium OttesenSCG-928-L17]
MQRADRELAFLLQYENIAWYEAGAVRILDRRVYPGTISFVTCHTHEEVARAIADMVTQSAGPYTAAAMGMALAAYECRNLQEALQKEHLTRAAYTIAHARPTTTARMKLITEGCLRAAYAAMEAGQDVPAAIVAHTIASNNARYEKIERIAEYLVDMIPNGGSVLTQCFGETIVGQMLKIARRRNNVLRVFCAETRPYFQGARLTASVAQDMGFETTVVTDNMPAYLMQQEKIDVFTSAADVICEDGHVVNKVGTFQIAIVAKYMGVPYFVTGAPDRGHPDVNSVHIEMRDPEFVLQAMGVRTAMEGVKGYYPSFDITPPHLVSGVVTECGIYSPYDLHRFYEQANIGEFDITV